MRAGSTPTSLLVAGVLALAIGPGCSGPADDPVRPDETGEGSPEPVAEARVDAEADAATEIDTDGLPPADAEDAPEKKPEADEAVEIGPVTLLAPPLGHRPTDTSFAVNVVADQGREHLRLEVRPAGSASWRPADGALRGTDVVEWTATDLAPAQEYEYRLRAGGQELHRGRAVTRRLPGEPFTFALLTDTHVYIHEPRDVAPVLEPIADTIAADAPDFVLHLGDLLDLHEFGFNDPPATAADTRERYLLYREMMGDLLAHTTHFQTIGNWDGENGYYTEAELDRSLSQRLLYLPNPSPTDHPAGGSARRDYYAFTWGDALFVVLNVMSYTLSPHVLGNEPPDDWTLGAEQLAWLTRTLEQATARWRFLCIHHTVGGNAGNASNSGYGRGGGRAAYVGEQAQVHDLMLRHGVHAFFYGHDHVFTDLVVDGVHYTLPGSAGAPWKFTAAETGYETFWTDSGYGRIQVSPSDVTVQFVTADGTMLHEYSLE